MSVLQPVLVFFVAAAVAGAAEPSPVRLQPVYRLDLGLDKHTFITPDDFDFDRHRRQLQSPAFYGVTTNTWPAGLVPIFAVAKSNRVEMRRLPPAGQENSSEPVFYGLPPDDEPEAFKIAGRWECRGTRETGSRELFGWDLAVDNATIAGRFDQFTDFRFARIAHGTFMSNRLSLRVEYLMDAYRVQGAWRDGQLTGTWKREDESEQGTWEATRPAVTLPAATNLVALYEWRRSDGARNYLLESEPRPPGAWQRALAPVCRVWKRL